MKIKYLWLVMLGLILLAGVALAKVKRADVGPSPDLTGQYDAYNFLYFKASLPHVTVLLSYAPDSPNMGETDPCGPRCFVITIFKQLNPAPKQESMTLLHEMVHVYLDTKGIQELKMHGPKFQAEMRKLADRGAFDQLW